MFGHPHECGHFFILLFFPKGGAATIYLKAIIKKTTFLKNNNKKCIHTDIKHNIERVKTQKLAFARARKCFCLRPHDFPSCFFDQNF